MPTNYSRTGAPQRQHGPRPRFGQSLGGAVSPGNVYRNANSLTSGQKFYGADLSPYQIAMAGMRNPPRRQGPGALTGYQYQTPTGAILATRQTSGGARRSASPFTDMLAGMKSTFQPKLEGLDHPAPPAQDSPHITSSIPLHSLQHQYLPESVVNTGINQQVADLHQSADPHQYLKGATQDNMASASGGVRMRNVMSQIMPHLQQVADVKANAPVEAAMQRYDFGTKGHAAQAKEVTNLANIAANRYSDRLRNWGVGLQQQMDLLQQRGSAAQQRQQQASQRIGLLSLLQ